VRILVTGVSGYIGSLLVGPLLADGHVLRGLSRDPAQVEFPIQVVAGDALTGEGLAQALEGIEVAYYLIHSMEPHSREPAASRSFQERESQAAKRFAAAATDAGVSRIVYLGGPVPSTTPVPGHLASKLAVERILLAAVPGSVAFRASIVVGAQSRSFRFLVRLIERLPVLLLPAWRTNRTAAVDERDVIEVLRRATSLEPLAGLSLDVPGPEVTSFGELIARIGDHMFLHRPTIKLRRLNLTPIASRLSAVISGEEHELLGPLMESLETDLLPRDARAFQLLAVRRHSLDAAIEHALREWEMTEPLAAR
jgi:uncharacterized protein YbjT (DUF2867 family)